jgi:hypothetical protein
VVGEHVDDFVVEAFVEVVAVFEVGFADFGLLWKGREGGWAVSSCGKRGDARDCSPETRESSFDRAWT